MEHHKNKMHDPATILSGSLDTIDMMIYNQTIVKAYFLDTLPEITSNIITGFVDMIQKSGDLSSAIKLRNNKIFISDALKKGISFTDINSNLSKIQNDPSTKQFALANPKKLGYLMTLEPSKLDKAIGILNHPKMGEFVTRNPQEIAFLTKVSDDPEKLLRAVAAIERFPSLKSVKSLFNATDRLFEIAINAPKASKRTRNEALEGIEETQTSKRSRTPSPNSKRPLEGAEDPGHTKSIRSR